MEGPISVPDYVLTCLHDPEDGYYSHHVHFDAEGDFLTAPRISQMFGEILGGWLVMVWIATGRPDPFDLIELGGGDGTLMKDVLRVLARVPECRTAAHIWMVEPSERLRAQQASVLGTEVSVVPSLSKISETRPFLLFANEVLDCLPAYQFVRQSDGWAERCIGLSSEGELGFCLTSARTLPQAPAVISTPGDILEVSPAQTALAAELGLRLKTLTGAVMLIDYGRDRPGFGDTLQALKAHRRSDPLKRPGQCDLTQWVDFPSVRAAALARGIKASPIISQRDFLRNLGIEARCQALIRRHPDQAEQLLRQLDRLIGVDQMGALFKVLALTSPQMAELPGFEAGALPEPTDPDRRPR